jgi:hypothetical protein
VVQPSFSGSLLGVYAAKRKGRNRVDTVEP